MPKSLNTFVSRHPENQGGYNQVRREALRELRLTVRGRAAVAQPLPGFPPRSVVDAQTRRNLFNTVEIPSNLTAEEKRAFTFSPFQRVQRSLGKEATPVKEVTKRANQGALLEMDSFYKSIIEQNTPSISAQLSAQRRQRPTRKRRLGLDSGKKEKRIQE